MINMNEDKKIRTVKVNERGQIVIPEEIRKDLGISKFSTLIMIENKDQIILKKESSVLKDIENENNFLGDLTEESLKRAWDKEDEIWDKIYKKEEK